MGAEGGDVHAERDRAGGRQFHRGLIGGVGQAGATLFLPQELERQGAGTSERGAEVAGEEEGEGDGEERGIWDRALAPLHGARHKIPPFSAQEEPQLGRGYASDDGRGSDV